MSQTVIVSGDYDDILYRLQHDEAFFIAFFMDDLLTLPSPEIHIQMLQRMKSLIGAKNKDGIEPPVDEDGDYFTRLALCIPRGHAKTTIAKLFCVWAILFSDIRFIVYCSKIVGLAQSALSDVVGFLETDNCVAMFGYPQYSIERRGEGFYEFIINGKKVILKAIGKGGQVRGLNVNNQRPQLAINDDIEDNEDVKNENSIENVKTWFFSQFLRAMQYPYSPVIYIGNLISNDGLLNTLIKDKGWMSILLGAILPDGTPLWPGLWSIEALKKDFMWYFRQGRVNEWYTEMMNNPKGGKHSMLDSEKCLYLPRIIDAQQIRYGFITVDPAISDKAWADEVCIMAHGWDGLHWRVLEYHHQQGMPFDEMFDKIIDLCFSWRIRVIGVESVAFQKVLIYLFEIWTVQYGYEDLLWVEVPNKKNKIGRIRAWCSLFHRHDYVFNDDDMELVTQITDIDPRKDDNEDDVADCGAFSLFMIDNFLEEIMQDLHPTKVVNKRDGFTMKDLSLI